MVPNFSPILNTLPPAALSARSVCCGVALVAKSRSCANGRAEQQIAHESADQEQLRIPIDLRKCLGQTGAELPNVGR